MVALCSDTHHDALPELVGSSATMQAVRQWARQVAMQSAPVLLSGETGTGKDVLARALAKRGPFIAINCGALRHGLIESELFGYERGAFTGAICRKKGAFEAADGGTLFLDEIGEMPVRLQAQLLRVLESGEVRRIGAVRSFCVRPRVVVATNRCLEREVRLGRFRADVFHRLHVLNRELPPLRHHIDDLPELARHFLHLDAKHARGRQPPAAAPPHLSRGALNKLMRHAFLGNVRELRNVLLRAMIMCPNACITEDYVTFARPMQRAHHADGPGGRTMRDIEREAILLELQRQRGNRKAAAQVLGLSRSTLHRRLHDLGLANEVV